MAGIGLGAGLALGAAVPAIASAIPTRAEREYKKSTKALGRRLALSRGGLKSGERQQLEAEGQQRLQAQMQQAQSDIARIQDPVARQRAMSKLQKGAMGQRAAISSDVRKQDLDLYAAMMQNYQKSQSDVARMAQQRKQAAIQAGVTAGVGLAGEGAKLGQAISKYEADKAARALSQGS